MSKKETPMFITAYVLLAGLGTFSIGCFIGYWYAISQVPNLEKGEPAIGDEYYR